jgi:type II secretory pathway pseudopilin PulG
MLRQRLSSDRGYAMAALLVSIGIMGVLASVVMPVWKQQAKREREAELIFRAGQYAHAVELFKRKTANQYPPDLDILVKQRFLRKKYKDPMTKNGEWRIVTPAELQGTPMGGSMPGLAGQQGGGFNNGRSSFGTGSPGQGSGLGQSGGGFGRPSMPGGQPSAPSAGGQNPGQQQPQPGDPNAPSGGPGSPSSFGSASGRGPVNLGPVATVASRSTEKSLLVFKGRERYDQWIVTIEDVMKRQVVNPQQQGQQPGQQGRPGSTPFGNRPNSGQTPSSMPSGFPTSSPSSSSPPRR